MTITPCLWFNGDAEAAAALYVSLFPNSSIGEVSRYGPGAPFPEGTALVVAFVLDGQPFQALNGGPQFPHTEAISLSVGVADTAEQDRYWDGLLADGGEESMCGWLKDRYGVSWQIVPNGLSDLLTDPDPGRRERATAAMLQMRKLDLAAMRLAADSAP